MTTAVDPPVPADGSHPLDAGLIALNRMLREGVVSPVELCEEALRRLASWEPHLNAFINVEVADAIAAARDLERGRRDDRDLLWGVPVAVKDNLDVAGVRTTAGSAVVDRLPDTHALAVQRLVDGGAVIVGKTNQPELAYGPVDTYAFGPTRNPWSLAHFAGGSSMGSGAAVAAGIVPVALGTDTTGSLRNPACWSGITAIKPTLGLVCNQGMVPLARTLDHIGPMTRSALDCAVVLDTLTRGEFGYADHTVASSAPLRVGVLRELFADLPGELTAVMARALDQLASLGMQFVDVKVPLWADAAEAALLLVEAQAATTHADLVGTAAGRLQPQVRERLERGARLPAEARDLAALTGRRFDRALEEVFESIDVLVLPGRERTAPPMDRSGRRPPGERGHVFNTPFNLTGTPALVLPVGFDTTGLPIGLQLAAPRCHDARLLRLAHLYQLHTDWHTARPAAPAHAL